MDYKKQKIPKALREQVWISKIGKRFESKCKTSWCRNKITVFDFQCGHDIPESRGGTTDISNLEPICSRCNLSMGNEFTFKQWCAMSKKKESWIRKLFGMKESGIKSSPKPMSPKDKPPKSPGRRSATLSLDLKARIVSISPASVKM